MIFDSVDDVIEDDFNEFDTNSGDEPLDVFSSDVFDDIVFANDSFSDEYIEYDDDSKAVLAVDDRSVDDFTE